MIHQAWLIVALTLLAVARLTRLINEDAILDPIRRPLTRNDRSAFTYFVTCPWCVSIWVGGGAAALVYFWHDTWPVQIGLLALAASQTAGMLALSVGAIEKAATD